MADYYVRPVNGTDAPGGGTTHALAYKTTQYALDDIGTTHGKGTYGDRLNICSEGQDTLTAALSLATYVAPSTSRPLVIRGYTSVANDGGMGNLSGNSAFSIINSSTTQAVICADMYFHDCLGYGFYLGANAGFYHCEIANTSSTAIRLASSGMVFNCYIHGYSGTGCAVQGGAGSVALGNYIMQESSGDALRYLAAAIGNVIVISSYSQGIVPSLCQTIAYNTIVKTGAQQGNGISTTSTFTTVIGNLVSNFATGLNMTSRQVGVLAGNATYNCATPIYDYGSSTFYGLYEEPLVLTQDPFVDAASGDYTLKESVATALGWPDSFYGLVGNASYPEIGAVWRKPGGGGAVSISSWRGGMIG